jgi:hypothetical protein
VRSEIVEHDDVVSLEGRDEELLDVGEKPLAVEGAVEQRGRIDAIVAQRGEEGRGLPVAVRHFGDESASARSPAVEAGHVGLGPGLVDKDETRRIDALLMASPATCDGALCPDDPSRARGASFFERGANAAEKRLLGG